MTRPDGSILTFVYDGSHRMTAQVDPEGQRITYSYDSLRRVTAIKVATGEIHTYSYGSTNSVVDPSSSRTTYLRDSNLNVTEVLNPLGKRTTFVWSSNELQAQVDALGNRTTLGFTTLNSRVKRLQSITAPTGNKFTFSVSDASVASCVSW